MPSVTVAPSPPDASRQSREHSSPEPPERSSRAPALLRACRPRQWSKNLLVLAAPAAAGVLDRPLVQAQVAGAFVVLCLISSATYLLNDVRDAAQDRLHPRKRRRPVASGELAPGRALRAAALLALLGVAGAFAISLPLGAVACCYLALTGAYSLRLRGVAVLDVLAIAGGFVLRAAAGGAASDIYLSRWFVIVTGCCAVFLVTAKRYAELREQAGATFPARATLRRYSPARLRATLLASAGAGTLAYAGWAFTRPAHMALYGLSLLPFGLWLIRYAQLIGAGAGEAPEELILRDRALLALSAVWAVLFLGGVYAGQ